MSVHSTDAAKVIAHAGALLTLAESLPPGTPGSAGLAYQAADLAAKVLLIEIDGTDIWSHDARRERVSAVLGISIDDQAFLHKTRQLDFYADASYADARAGAPLELPTSDERARAVIIARRILDAVGERRR